MATKLNIYNKALRHLGPERLHPTQGLSENRADRRELDAAWDGAVQEMLERATWRFALRAFEATPDPNIVPSFGSRLYGYDMPDDFVRLHAIATDEDFNNEDLSFDRGNGVRRFFSVHDRLYISIVSNGANYGLNIGAYSELYAEALGVLLASKVAVVVTKDQNLESKLYSKFERIELPKAKKQDALDDRVKFKPVGSWVRSRFNASRGGYRGRIA